MSQTTTNLQIKLFGNSDRPGDMAADYTDATIENQSGAYDDIKYLLNTHNYG